MGILYRIIANLLIFIVKTNCVINNRFTRWAYSLCLKDYKHHEFEEKENSKKISSSIVLGIDTIANTARESSESLCENDSEFKEAVYLYFITKYSIAYMESKNNRLTIQVVNELRSALDHFFRALIVSKNDLEQRKKHLEKMNGHIQRALLDVTKINCSSIANDIKLDQKKYGHRAVSKAKDGDYIKYITASMYKAESSLAEAKISELNLGGSNDTGIREKFLQAFSDHAKAYEYHKQSITSLILNKYNFFMVALYTLMFGLFVKLLVEIFYHTPFSKKLVLMITDYLMLLINTLNSQIVT